MAFLLDTNIAIHLRDGDAEIEARIDALAAPLFISIVTRIELEADPARRDVDAQARTARLDALLMAVPALPFTNAESDIYRSIVAHCGYSRRKVLDRMIAAQAIVANATLVTRNGADLHDIPDLGLLEW